MTGLFAAKQDFNIKKMITRMLGAAKFNATIFRELRDDPGATFQALILAPITGFCYSVGLSLFIFQAIGLSLNEVILLVVLGLILACIIALTWSATTYAVVTRIFRRTISYPNLARPFLFSWTPGLLFILLAIPIPVVSDAFRAVATAWVALSSIFAVRYSSDLTVQQSMITFILSVLILVFALIIVSSLLPLFFT